MSACMMRCLAEIAAKGVKTDKGFKEIHIAQAAKALTQLVGYEVTTTQVSNHLRKWKVRYQRIEKLRVLSGALWDDDQKIIVLEEQHYLGHTLVCMYILKSELSTYVLNYLSLVLKHAELAIFSADMC